VPWEHCDCGLVGVACLCNPENAVAWREVLLPFRRSPTNRCSDSALGRLALDDHALELLVAAEGYELEFRTVDRLRAVRLHSIEIRVSLEANCRQ
jgi:hypothetical protein